MVCSAPVCRLLALCTLLAGLLGCAEKNIMTIDGGFSWNLVRTPAWFPDTKKEPLAAAEQEVFDKRGRPDFIRIYWRADGSLITSRDLSGLQPRDIAERLATAKKSWIYTADNEEVVFLANGGSYRTQPLTEKMKLLCSYGDPSTMSQPVVREGTTHEYWQWIEHGIQVELVDGAEVKRSFFKGTGAGTYLLK